MIFKIYKTLNQLINRIRILEAKKKSRKIQNKILKVKRKKKGKLF